MPLVTYGDRPQRKMIMSHLLCLTSSPRGDASASHRVAAHVPKELQLMHRQATVTTRALAREPHSHFDDHFGVATRAEGLAEA
jgi:FMN-dependent NADH-azoreductase